MTKHWESWSQERLELNWLKAMLDPWHFLTTFVYTTDPHDAINPIKLFPPKSYLQFLVSVWLRESKLLVPKSRQILVSWCMVACHLWLAITGRGRFIYFQSQKEEKADKLIQRVNFICKQLPPMVPEFRYTYCKLKFDGLDSMIEGVPQGADSIRQETCTAIYSDEMAFQEEAEKAYIASKPTIDGGGRYTGVSSANGPNFFKRLVFDGE